MHILLELAFKPYFILETEIQLALSMPKSGDVGIFAHRSELTILPPNVRGVWPLPEAAASPVGMK